MECIVKKTQQNPTSCVIWMHGLGANNTDFVNVIPSLYLNNESTRFIFPQAPMRSITINGGMDMPGWYDIISLDRAETQDVEGILQSVKNIHNLINKQIISGISSNKIMLVGFSQGGAIALFAGLSFDQPLSGVVGMSSYLPAHDAFSKARTTCNQDTPVLLQHGEYDDVVNYNYGRMTFDWLKNLKYHIDWERYHMKHTVLQEQLKSTGIFIKQCINRNTTKGS